MEPQVNKTHYFKKKYEDIERFISYFQQVSLIKEFSSPGKKILEIGKGSGLISDYLKRSGFDLTTCDFDKNLEPDIIADIRSLPIGDNAFEIVTAFEVLEHIPFEDFPKALEQLKKVSKKYVIISLPYRSTSLEFVLKFPGIRTLFKREFISLFLRWPLKFGGINTSGQHYWEIDNDKWRLSKIRSVLKEKFKILKEIRPVLNSYHKFFILEKP